MSHAIAGGEAGKSASAAGKSTSNDALVSMAKQFASETSGVRNELISQFEDILKTGGSQATIPIIGKAVEASKQATSNTLRQTNEELARTGLAGTPFAAMTQAQTLQAGNQAASQVPTDIVNQFLQMIPAFVLGQTQTATQGLGTATTNQTNLAQQGLQGFYKSVNLGK